MINLSRLMKSLLLSAGFFAAGGLALAAPITIEEQGSFTVGGKYKQHDGIFSDQNFLSEAGQRAYGDFAYVEYQKPVNARKFPLIFQHGGAQV